MTPDVRTVRAEKWQNRGLQSVLCLPRTLQEGSSTGSRVINEVVLRTGVNKGIRKDGAARMDRAPQTKGGSAMIASLLLNGAVASVQLIVVSFLLSRFTRDIVGVLCSPSP